jgi:hypothetical protein
MAFLPPVLLLLLSGALARDLQPPQIVRDKARIIELKTGSINRFVLECVAIAEPAPTYYWYRNGEELRELEGVVRVEDAEHSQLDFTSPQEHQAGVYHCEAENSVGRAKSSLSRVVLSPPVELPGTSAPVFTRNPQTEVQTLGSRVELRCTAKGEPQPEIIWLKNSQEVMRGAENLIIPALQQSDVANYACNASNIAGYVYKNVIVNILTVAAKIKEGPKEVLVASKGRDVVLPCRAEGYPVPTIIWSKDGKLVEEGDGEKYRIDSGFLKILKASTLDQGNYSCTATNQGTDTVEGRLVVQDKTEIIHGPTDETVPVQQKVLEMECEVVADQSQGQVLTVNWKKDGKDLGSAGFPKGDRVQHHESNNSLILRDLAFSDSGIYTCVGGTSIRDLDTMSGVLTVVGVAPSLAMADVETEWWEGDRIEVECLLEKGLTEQGRPRIYWYKDGERVGREGKDNFAARIEDDGQRLIIDRATTQHSGLWVCKAGNSEGQDVKQIELSVRRRTQLARHPEDLEFTNGKEAIFQCVAVADPTLQQDLSVIWHHDGKEVSVDCAYTCRDGVTCLQAEKICDGEENCPLHEGGSGGEDEETCDLGSGEYDEDDAVGQDTSPCALGTGSKFVLSDHSLLLCNPTKEDIGEYSCLVSSRLEQAIPSQAASLYIRTEFPWWIIFLLFAILTLLLCICIFVFCWRKKRRSGKGFYNPMDPENMKHNKSDIYYTTEDADSIMHEVDTSCSDLMEGNAPKTPIFTPKTLRHLSSSGTGSASSLLEDDEFLKRGMNEDGSFRERYAE